VTRKQQSLGWQTASRRDQAKIAGGKQKQGRKTIPRFGMSPDDPRKGKPKSDVQDYYGGKKGPLQI